MLIRGEEMSNKLSLLFVFVPLALVFQGCASVTVERVDFNDLETKGFRYYLPRPCVAVNEPFVVGPTKTFIVNGLLTADGEYIILPDLSGDDDIGGYFKTSGNFTLFETSKVWIDFSSTVPKSDEEGGPQAKEENEGGDGKSDDGKDKEEKGDSDKDDDEDVEEPDEEVESGSETVEVETDNSALPITPLKRYFDIVYIPDSRQQYAVRGKAGLGNSKVKLSLGQGGMIQGMFTDADNSALNKALIGLMESTTPILLNKLSKVLDVDVEEDEEEKAEALQFKLDEEVKMGTPLSVKVSIVRLVSPGLYPVLWHDEGTGINLDLNNPPISNHYYVIPIGVENGKLKPFLIFSTYEVIVVEATKPVGDSPLRMHQYIDFETGKASKTQGDRNGPPPSFEEGKGQVIDAVNSELGNIEIGWKVVDLVKPDKKGEGIKVHVEKIDETKAAELDKVRNEIKKMVNKYLLKVFRDDPNYLVKSENDVVEKS